MRELVILNLPKIQKVNGQVKKLFLGKKIKLIQIQIIQVNHIKLSLIITKKEKEKIYQVVILKIYIQK